MTNYSSRTDHGYQASCYSVPPYTYLGYPSTFKYDPQSGSYTAANGAYPPYEQSYALPSSSQQAYSSNAGNYSVAPPVRSSTLNTFLPSSSHSHGLYSRPHRSTHPRIFSLAETEPQTSPNAETMMSEPLEDPLDGYPTVETFDQLVQDYVKGLSPKKQDKALIGAKRAASIRMVLVNKKTTQIESAQFRFWVKKMFTLVPPDPHNESRDQKICHEDKPIAVREKLFKILTRAHQKVQHGGRDKTSHAVRQTYSWVPKELISRFVKACPTCSTRRASKPSSNPDSSSSEHRYDTGLQTTDTSPDVSRRGSVVTTHQSYMLGPFAKSSADFHNQNKWLEGYDSRTVIQEEGSINNFTAVNNYPNSNWTCFTSLPRTDMSRL